MNIKINQTLHGYLEGHQLLAASLDLDIEVKKVLLFQSDLSGSNIYKGFDSYLSGYPIPNSKYYALAMTWYASEMPRPGCVWTQTLLIELVDLGKIPEFASLMPLFRRPVKDLYESYSIPITIDFLKLNIESDYNQANYDLISTFLYRFPQQAILIPANDSQVLQNELLKIWSDQWPRLRRAFTFCTGALGLRQLNNRNFDLQIVPTAINFKQLDGTSFLLVGEGVRPKSGEWLSTIRNSSKNDLRRFLWSFGADIEGSRASFPKILNLYDLYINEDTIHEFGNSIRRALPQPAEGRSLKQFVFNSPEPGRFSEIEILEYLVTEPDLGFLSIEQYAITERLITLVNLRKITLARLGYLVRTSQNQRISPLIWESIDYSVDSVIEAMQENPSLVPFIISKNIEYCSKLDIWRTDIEIQREVARCLRNEFPVDIPSRFLTVILESHSLIVSYLLELYGRNLVPEILNWFSQPDNLISADVLQQIVHRYDKEFVDWIAHRMPSVPAKIYQLMFANYSGERLFSIQFSVSQWLMIFDSIKLNNSSQLPYVSTILLSIGFRNNLPQCELLVVKTFNYVFDFASESKLGGIWEIIPQDLEGFEEDEDLGVFDAFFRLFGINPAKKRFQSPYWDHCELLVVTYNHKFIKNNWSLQSYLNGLCTIPMFNRAVAYCISFKKGRDYLRTIRKFVHNGRLQVTEFQRQVLDHFDDEGQS